MVTVGITQNSTVKILDLSVYPAIELDSISGTPADTSTILFNLDFKINDVSNASSVRILVGTVQNSGDITDITSNIVYQGGQYYINHNGINIPLNGYSISLKLNLSKQQEAAYNNITLFVVDNSGSETNMLHFTR